MHDSLTAKGYWKRIAVGAGCALLAAIYAVVSGPRLPHRLEARELSLLPKGNVAFDGNLAAELEGVCLAGDPLDVRPKELSGLTLDFGHCAERELKLIGATPTSSTCAGKATGVLVLLRDVPQECGAHYILRPGEPGISADRGIDLLLRANGALFGNLGLAKIVTDGTKETESVGALGVLGNVSGRIAIAATSLRLHELKVERTAASGPDAVMLHAEFGDSHPGIATLGEANGTGKIWLWRLVAFLVAFGSVFATVTRLLVFFSRKAEGQEKPAE